MKCSIRNINLPDAPEPTRAAYKPVKREAVKSPIATFADRRVREQVRAKARVRRAGKAEKRHDEIAKLAQAGMSDEQIAEETGYKKDSIRRIVNQMRREGVDIPHRKRGRKCMS